MPDSAGELSKREQEVVNLASMGLLDKEICQRLGITDNTLKTYWKRIRAKLGDASRPGLVAAYLRQRAAEQEAPEIQFEADWVYDYRTKIWEHTSDRAIPGNLQVKGPILLEEVLSYFHPEDAAKLEELVDGLASNDVEDFFFRARLVTSNGLVQTSTFVHVIRSDGRPVKLLGHRSTFHDLAPVPVRELMVGYWEQDLASGEFTADVNLLFIFSSTGEGPSVSDTKYSRIPAEELQEVRKAVTKAVDQKRVNLRAIHSLETHPLPFRWATIDVRVEYAEGTALRAHGSVLAFS